MVLGNGVRSEVCLCLLHRNFRLSVPPLVAKLLLWAGHRSVADGEVARGRIASLPPLPSLIEYVNESEPKKFAAGA